jgi:hypothetical protein
MLKAPVFIGGAGRSGTTLLADLMGCHPEISPVYETDFLRDFLILFCAADCPSIDVACEQAFRYMDRWSASLPHRPHNKGDHERYVHGPHYLLFERSLTLRATRLCLDSIRAGAEPAQAIGRLSTQLFEAHAVQDSKPRWVNKTPANLSIFPELTRAFGRDLRFIHILRDPRDVACSVVDRPWGPQRHGDVGAWWAGKIGRGLQFAYSNDVPYLEVHFEDLVQNPAPVLNEIFQFVNEAPLGEEVAQRHAMGRIPFDASRVGRWERDFPNSERQAFLHHCGKLMDQVGYGWPLTSTTG